MGALHEAVGTAAATQNTNTIVYILTAGTFDAMAGVEKSNWKLGGTNVEDLGTISTVALSTDDKTATITVSGAVGANKTYTVAPAQGAFATGVAPTLAVAVSII